MPVPVGSSQPSKRTSDERWARCTRHKSLGPSGVDGSSWPIPGLGLASTSRGRVIGAGVGFRAGDGGGARGIYWRGIRCCFWGPISKKSVSLEKPDGGGVSWSPQATSPTPTIVETLARERVLRE